MRLRFQAILSTIICFGLLQAKTVDKIEIEGLSINSPAVVRNALEIREGKEFNSSDVQESLRRLYGTGLFGSVDFMITSETDSSISLRLKLEENPIFEDVEYKGNKKLKVKDFEEKITLKRGQILTDLELHEMKMQLKDMYQDKGYNLAEIDIEKIPTKIPGNTIVKVNIDEGPRVRVRSIVFKGNNEIDESKLKRKLKTKEKKWFRSGEYNEELFKTHLDTLIMYYNDQGFLDASVVKDSVWFADNNKDLFVEITIDEGRKYYTGDFFFRGNRIIETDSLLSKIYLKKGKAFEKNRFDMSKYMIENAYREEGYLWIHVNDSRQYRGDTIDVTFDITEGRSAVVRKIDIRGNDKTMEKVIRREIDLLPGKKYKQSLMLRSRQKILALNYFDDARPDLVPNEDGTIDLVFDIVEKDNIGQLQVGAAYSGTQKFVGTFSTSIPNLRGTGQELGINLEYGADHRDIRLRFREPWAFDRPLSLSGEVFYTRDEYYDGEEYQSTGFAIGAGASKLKWPDDHFTVHGTYRLSYEKTSARSDTFPEHELTLLEDGVMSRLSLKIERYDLDMPLFPSEGSRLTITPEIAGLGGDYKYFKGIVGYEHYFPLPAKFVLGSRTRMGAIRGLGISDLKISRYDLFRLGGVYSVDADLRGYPDYAFGGLSYEPQSGLNMFASTLELRYPILEQQLYLGVFADVGNTWSRLSDINLSDLRKSVGFGLRINVPMLGIMGFDFAWGLDPVEKELFSQKPNGFQFHFLMNRGF